MELLVLGVGLEVNPSVPMSQELYPVQKNPGTAGDGESLEQSLCTSLGSGFTWN